LKISNEYDTLIWISFAIKHKPQTTVLTVALVVLVAMMFLVPAITDKAMGLTNHQVADYGTYKGSCCTNHLYSGVFSVDPDVKGSFIEWKTKPFSFLYGDESGYITATIKFDGKTAVADFGWSNPSSGDNSCNVDIHPPLKGILRPSCYITSGNTAEAVYCIDGIPIKQGQHYEDCSRPNLNKSPKSK
jgi:hypothetical protein